jgi:lipopolysaccharide transport system ATP-binding protein
MIARLGFSVATDKRPEILIVDEVLSVGDAEFQTKSFERIQGFQALGTTILLVSHSLEKVEQMCSRVVWLGHGKVVALGSAKAVVSQYLGRVAEEEANRLTQERQEREQVLAQGHDGNVQRPPDEWGNHKVEIVGVRITNEHGTEQTIFRTGQTMILDMHYIAHEPVQAPIFGIAIHRQDGIHVTGPNTAFADLKLPRLEGKGTVTYTIPYLPLLEGLYQFSMAVVNQDDSEIYDYHDRTFPFRVINMGEAIKERYGLMTLRGEWKHQAE